MEGFLQYLNNNIGKPIFIEDLYQAFPHYDREVLDSLLNEAISKGLIYTFNNAFYLTRYGQSFIEKPNAVNPYIKAQQRGVNYQNRNEFLQKWLKHFLGSLEVFKRNHPELKNLFDILGVKAEDDIIRWHDANEFVKDVQAIFSRFDFTVPELRYAPKEVDYNVPENLMSIEHAIAESLNRLMKYSPRHTSYITDPRKYRNVYDKVNNFLSQDNVQAFLIKNLDLKDGTFIKKENVKSQLIQLFTKTVKGENLELVKVSFEQLNNKVNQVMQSISPNLFFEGEDMEEAADRLYQLVVEKGSQVLNNFSESATSPIRENILRVLFYSEDFQGLNLQGALLTNININNCNFQGADLSFTVWKDSTVTNNNFQGVSFQGADFKEIQSFRDNNIDQADFDRASLSSEVDKDVNRGEPLNYTSLKLTKQEMEEKGFREDESFDHIGLELNKNVPGGGVNIGGKNWIRYVQATPLAPFPKELFQLFNLHKVPLERFLGWIGGKYENKTKTLYVTKVRSDLLQRTFQLSKYFIEKAKGSSKYDEEMLNLKQLGKFSQYKNALEQYFKGWPQIFMNQAVREAKNKGANYIAVPADNSPNSVYNRLVTTQNYPYNVKNGWNIIPVNRITKWANLQKLSWQDNIIINNYTAEWIWDNIDVEFFWIAVPEGSYDNFEGYNWESLPKEVQEEFKQVLQLPNIQRILNTYFRKIPLRKSKLSWKIPSNEFYEFEEVLRNRGIVYYDNYNKRFNPQIKSNSSLRLGWLEPPRDLTGWMVELTEDNKSVTYGVVKLFTEDFISAVWADTEQKALDWRNRYLGIQLNREFFIIKPMYYVGLNKLSSLKFSADEPSEAQLEAGNYKKDHIRKDGFDITIENKKGSTRSGTDPDGNKWSIKMKHAYGYIKGTVGKDKDHVDCILADNYKEGKSVFIVNQLTDKGGFDEHKCVMGVDNKEDAEKIYLDNYEKGWDQYDKDLVEMSIDEFKDWVMNKKETKKKAKESMLKLSWQEAKKINPMLIEKAKEIAKSEKWKEYIPPSVTIPKKPRSKYYQEPGTPVAIFRNSEVVRGIYYYIIGGYSTQGGWYLLLNEKGEIRTASGKVIPIDSLSEELLNQVFNPKVKKLSWNEEVTNKVYWVYNRDTGVYIRKATIEEISQLYKISPAFIKRSIEQNIGIGGIYILDPDQYDRKPLRIKNKLERESETRGKKIIGTRIETGTEYPFNSVGEAAREIGVSRAAIFQALKSGGNAGGFQWRYAEEKTSSFKLSWQIKPTTLIRKDGRSHRILKLFGEATDNIVRNRDIVALGFASQYFTYLLNNHFVERIDRGLYHLTPKGKLALYDLENLKTSSQKLSWDDFDEDNDYQYVDPEGNPIEPSEPFDTDFYETEEEEDVDILLDQLSEAKELGNEERVIEIKRKLDKIIGLSSLSFKRLKRKTGIQENLQNFKKDPYKSLRFNYNPERGQQINEYEPAEGESSALSPLDMYQIYDTDFFEPDLDQWDEENESLDWQDRSNLQFGM